MVTTHIWRDSYNTRNFPAIKTMIVQTCNILQGNSRWTFQAHSLIFRQCNTHAMLQKANFIQFSSVLSPIVEVTWNFFVHPVHYPSHVQPTWISHLWKHKITLHLLVAHEEHIPYEQRPQSKYQHALNVRTDFFAFFGSGGDRLFHWGLIFGFHIAKVRPRFISSISKAVPPPPPSLK
jgi:hypothetical protein